MRGSAEMTDETTGAGEYPHLVDGPEGMRRTSAREVTWTDGAEVVTFAIVSDNPATAPIKRPDNGGPIYWQQVRELVIGSGKVTLTVYGCAHCDYVRERARQIVPHLGRHNRRATPAKGDRAPSKPTEMSLNEALTALNRVQWLTEQMDGWKARALKAERELAKFKRMFRSLGES